MFILHVSKVCNTLQVPNDQDSAGTTPVCLNCESLKKDKKKLQWKVRKLETKMSQLKDRMDTNQEDWAISFKELSEYQQPVLVTSGVFETILPPPIAVSQIKI